MPKDNSDALSVLFTNRRDAALVRFAFALLSCSLFNLMVYFSFLHPLLPIISSLNFLSSFSFLLVLFRFFVFWNVFSQTVSFLRFPFISFSFPRSPKALDKEQQETRSRRDLGRSVSGALKQSGHRKTLEDLQLGNTF